MGVSAGPTRRTLAVTRKRHTELNSFRPTVVAERIRPGAPLVLSGQTHDWLLSYNSRVLYLEGVQPVENASAVASLLKPRLSHTPSLVPSRFRLRARPRAALLRASPVSTGPGLGPGANRGLPGHFLLGSTFSGRVNG